MTTENDQSKAHKLRRRRCLIKVGAIIIVLIIVLFVVALILALTVFKPKKPNTELLLATLSGVSPQLSLPIKLNITLDLKILVENPNYASFQHGGGKSLLLYQGNQFGEADIFPGNIPSRDSTVLPCLLTIEVDEFGSDLSGLLDDILSGELVMETRTRIPGRVTFLGFIKKHVVAVSVCQFTIGLLDMKVRSNVCISKNET